MAKLIGALLLFFILIGIPRLREKIKGNKADFDGIRDRALIDRAIDKLDGRFKRPFPAFEAPADVMEILNREPDSEYAMNIFLQKVAAHCGFDRHKVMLRAHEAKEGMPPGRIQKLGSQFLMELYMNNEGDVPGVLAVIIHEFCHFFLDESGIELVNTLENEVLTDTAAIYFGFGKLLRAGYEPRLKTAGDGKNTWHRIGYLDTLNIDYVISQLERREMFYKMTDANVHD